MSFDREGRGWWPHGEMTDSLPQAPLHSVLRWILNQLNYGCVTYIGEGGEPPAHTVVLGREAANYLSAEEAVAEVQKRALAVSMAGVFATARERGVEPEHEALAEEVVRLANENGKANTALHYAYKLVDILERISKRTWVFDAPPIVGRAEPQTLDLLQEATRCYLFGLHRACVAICRAVLEDSLKQRVPKLKVVEEGMQRGDAGELERLINAAVRAVSTSLRQPGSAFTVATPRHRRGATTTDRAAVAAGQRPHAGSRPGCRSSVLGHLGGSFSTAD